MVVPRPKAAWSNSTFVRTSLPFFGFVVFAWLGMSQLMESKLRIRVSMKYHTVLHTQKALTGIASAADHR